MNTLKIQSMTVGVWLVATGLIGAEQAPAMPPPSARDEIAALKKASRGFSEVAKSSIPAVVFVTVERSVTMRGPMPFFGLPFDFFGGEPEPDQDRPSRQRGGPQFRQEGQGSGFLISKEGYILSNSHVVSGADKITVHLHDGRQLTAKLLGADRRSDVAVLKVEGDNFPFLKLGDSDAIDIGEWVIAVGTPFGLTETLTVGVVSAKGRNVGLTDYEDLIQTDAAINPGNSGGPLLNIDGEVIGITSSIFSQSGGYMGIGFAVPINMAKTIQGQLVKTGRVVRGYLGVLIQDLTPDLAKSFELDQDAGLLISEVVPDSPAAKAGLKPGDVIVEQDGKKVQSSSAFRNALALQVPGTKTKFVVRRDGKSETLTAEIGQQKEDEPDRPEAPSSLLGKLGVTVLALSPERRQKLGIPEDVKGVLVTEVEPGSPAASSGLAAGDVIMGVNKRSVETVEDFQKALEHSAKSKRVLLLVKNRLYTRFVVIPLDGESEP
jgi:serine protease Do